jgi:transcriptional regulator with XRE-family HTH domain
VSKWERGETFPDITMLPAIAAFFGVTVDDMLGVSRSGREQRVQYYIDEYYRLWRPDEVGKVREKMKEAITEFPGDFRLLARYLNALIVEKNTTNEGALEILDEARTIYENINEYCTEDSIRIWAKKLICMLYKRLSFVEKSGIQLSDMEKILDEMPLMQNGRDFVSTILYPAGEKHREACKNTVRELMYLIGGAISNGFFWSGGYTPEEKLEAAKTLITVYEAVYPEGDYGKSSLYAINTCLYAGNCAYRCGRPGEAVAYLKKGAELAKQFDELPEQIEQTSPLVKGLVTVKSRIPNYRENLREHAKQMIAQYAFGDELKSSETYKEVLEILEF